MGRFLGLLREEFEERCDFFAHRERRCPDPPHIPWLQRSLEEAETVALWNRVSVHRKKMSPESSFGFLSLQEDGGDDSRYTIEVWTALETRQMVHAVVLVSVRGE